MGTIPIFGRMGDADSVHAEERPGTATHPHPIATRATRMPSTVSVSESRANTVSSVTGTKSAMVTAGSPSHFAYPAVSRGEFRVDRTPTSDRTLQPCEQMEMAHCLGHQRNTTVHPTRKCSRRPRSFNAEYPTKTVNASK